MRAVVGVLLALALFFGARVSSAQECPEGTRARIAGCGAESGVELSVARCPEGVIVVHAGGQANLDIEIAPKSPRSFHTVGELGVSPIGQFADWAKEPEARRVALSAVEKCVAQGKAVVLPEKGSAPASPLPIPLLIGVVSVLVCWMSGRRGNRARGLLVALSAWAIVLGLRWMLLAPAFFHQNGHGPAWIQAALSSGGFSYGPGFRELFAAIARAGGTTPERGVFLAAAALGATVPVSGYLGARGVGASKLLALALALSLAVDPVLIRIAASESYFGIGTALAFAAAGLVAWSSARPKRRTLVIATLAAGALIAEAARVHPVTWLPTALIPTVALLGPGSLRRRLRVAFALGAGSAVVVALLAGPSLLAVLRGSLGHQWMPAAGPRTDVLGALAPLVVMVAVLGAAARPRGFVIAAVFAAALLVARVFDLLSAPNPAVDAAALRLYWPVLSLALVAWIVRASRRARSARFPRWAPAALFAAVGALHAAITWRPMTALPTDALEQRFALAWRTELSRDTRVVYLRQVGQRVMTLPLYDGVTATPLPVAEADAAPLSSMGSVLYYRSSLCASEEGRPVCERIEHGATLTPVVERELPARPSMRWSPLPGPSLHVGLYRVSRPAP